MKIDKEFKRALSELSDREKDKLVAMLVRRDKKLAKRLHYELIGDFPKEDLQDEIFENTIAEFEKLKRNPFQPKYLSATLRKLSAEIAGYLFTTKDKYGEASLNLFLLNKTFEYFSDEINIHYRTEKGNKLTAYIVNKTFNTRILINRLEDDFYIDFKDDLKALGKYFGGNEGIMGTSIFHGFDVNWLMNERLPEDIERIQKDLRRRGYLK